MSLFNREPSPPTVPVMYTEEQLMARLKFFIGICLSLTLFGIVFVVLYSLIFVTQPLNAISPIDQKFFELIVPIATFLTGTLSGIMLSGSSKEDKEAMLAAQNGGNIPMTKSTYIPRRKALAMTFKKHHGFHQDGGYTNDPALESIQYALGGNVEDTIRKPVDNYPNILTVVAKK